MKPRKPLNGRWLLPILLIHSGLAALASASFTQSTPELLNSNRPLLPGEIARVLEAVREAINGRTLRLSYRRGAQGPELLMGPDGRPRLVLTRNQFDTVSATVSSDRSNGVVETRARRDVVVLTEYSSLPARACNGTVLDGELVIEYQTPASEDHWRVAARRRTNFEFGMPLFDILAGATRVQGGELKLVGDRPARALVAAWNPPPGSQIGAPVQTDMTQSLWIDTESMLPIVWSISPTTPFIRVPTDSDYALWFDYDHSIELHVPERVARPDCIPYQVR